MIAQVQTEEKDNRNLEQGNEEAQKLSQEVIEKMKRDGADGIEIVTALIKHSASYEAKTVFSQEKWLKKKIGFFHVSGDRTFFFPPTLLATGALQVHQANFQPHPIGVHRGILKKVTH